MDDWGSGKGKSWGVWNAMPLLSGRLEKVDVRRLEELIESLKSELDAGPDSGEGRKW